ncbi:molecular chaperone DnaJ [Leptospira kemamanensis]|uniref:Molecular chaperone DnaJ n=1 Tax=Leptospira kemamanensis TaxID=2484942 RepID=A0A4R9JR71_9LEPT|nr:DnaJ domain-containing protein [Leptospira kemamanensis]TGL54977.1 molecular chaperone DnaJ [Leptospira kemamanensis]
MARTKRETYYEILGVSRDSSRETIEEVFLKEIQFFRLLETSGSLEAQEKILELTKAYLTLSDPQKRKKYDGELDFEFVLLDGKAKDPEIEEAYDAYRLGHKKSYQEILKEFTKFREEMGETLWVLKKTTIYLVGNLLVYSGLVLYRSITSHTNPMEAKEDSSQFDTLSLFFLGFSFLGYLFFRFTYLPKQLEKRRNQKPN